MSTNSSNNEPPPTDSLDMELPFVNSAVQQFYAPPPAARERLLVSGKGVPHVASMADYERMYRESVAEPAAFWSRLGRELVEWSRPFSDSAVCRGSFANGDISWFGDGELNVSYNCVDRHAYATPNRVAIIYEADEPGTGRSVTYAELLREVSRLANVLKSLGVRRGDCVAIYMPMVPEAAYAMLACARIGAVHSVVFAGFSAEALRDRIIDASCKLLITADQGMRGGKPIQLKQIADNAVVDCPTIEKVLVFQRTGDLSVPMHATRDVIWSEAMAAQRPYCPPEALNAEHPLFFLYTSGSTGKPKGLMHSQGGYLVGAATTVRYSFDLHDGDVFGCMADVGWITGHSYIVYGPLANGLTTVMLESIPTYPDAGRYWQMIQEHKITHFYTAPTAIRALKRLGDDWVNKYDLSSLRAIGTVGEPINPEAWQWYFRVVGKERCAVIDTYWQTETGSFLIAPYACATPTKAGSATLPQFGIVPAILDATTGKVMEGNNVTGVLCVKQPWPSMARTISGNHQRFMDTYLTPYPGHYFTGDGALRDKDGYYWILGRVDDVINVSGHRLSTAEIEAALVTHRHCAEAAVVGVPDEITGQSILAFCVLKPGVTADIRKELVLEVRKVIGPFAAPKRVVLVSDMPKTRSGKIMRRVLRKIAAGEVDSLGDVSTLADPSVVAHLVERIASKE